MTKKKPKAYRGVQSYLTEEQISVLSKNPNIIKVTSRQVHYTQTNLKFGNLDRYC